MTQISYNHILLADDDLDDCDFFSDILNSTFPDIKLSICNDGGNLMKHLNTTSVPSADLIFLDLNMPVLTGAECLEKIRSSENLKNNIIIIFTTSNSSDDIAKMYGLGANYFITKPSNYGDMNKLICKAMELSSQTHNQQPSFENFYIKL